MGNVDVDDAGFGGLVEAVYEKNAWRVAWRVRVDGGDAAVLVAVDATVVVSADAGDVTQVVVVRLRVRRSSYSHFRQYPRICDGGMAFHTSRQISSFR